MRRTRPRKSTNIESYQLVDLAKFAMNATPRQPSRLPYSSVKAKRLPVRSAACVLCAAFLLCLPVLSQAPTVSTPTTPQAEIPTDSLGRTTPRGTVLGFLLAARSGDDEAAARYLNIAFAARPLQILPTNSSSCSTAVCPLGFTR